jgi:lysophospholipase L1-like esterase
MTRRSLFRAAALAAFAAWLYGTGALAQSPATGAWVTAWGTSQQSLGMSAVTNASVRLIARVTIPGDSVRVRLANTFGTAPVMIGNAFVGQRAQGAALVTGSNRKMLFSGAPTVTIPPNGTVMSDPVSLKVLAGQDLAVSLFVPGADVRPSQHNGAVVTSYLSAANSGDVTADETRTPYTATTTSMFWLKSIDVLSSTSTGSIVAFGDSITDGTCTTLDANNRWEDWLAVRLQLEAEGRGAAGAHKAVVNEGIGGNTVTRDVQPPPDSTPGVERLDRDVLSHSGVTHVVVFMGTNDIRRGATAAQIIAGTEDIIKRIKARHLSVIGVTIIPRHNAPPSGTNTGWDAAKTAVRDQVNQWIRSRAPFDAVIDFDRVVRDSGNPALISAPFNCDGIHPNPRGYYEMGKSVRLDLFKEGLRSPASK